MRDAPTPGAIREEMERILASPDFDASARNGRFLRYVVDETLSGRGDRIKAYPIAITVFGRDDSFDSQIDPIVRIEARRLRSALERYYLLSGQSDPVRISVPKGSYVPTFSWSSAEQGAEAAAAMPSPRPAPRRPGPSVIVVPFDAEGEGPAAATFARGFARQIIVALTRFADLLVYGAATSLDTERGTGHEPAAGMVP